MESPVTNKKRKSFPCDLCNWIFTKKVHRQAHLRTHTGERPFLCSYPDCKKAFAQRGNLRTHELVHSGEKPYACPSVGCRKRNRQAVLCTKHPQLKLKKDGQEQIFKPKGITDKEKKWFKKYEKEKNESSKRKIRKSLPAIFLQTEATPSSSFEVSSCGSDSGVSTDSNNSNQENTLPSFNTLIGAMSFKPRESNALNKESPFVSSIRQLNLLLNSKES